MGDNYIMKTMRVVSLACNVPTGLPLQSYQILSKYVQGNRSYGENKNVSTDGRRHADRYIPPQPLGRGITNILRAQFIQEKLFHILSLHKNAVVITMIITSNIYQHYNAIVSHV